MPLLKQRLIPDTSLPGDLPVWLKSVLTSRGIDSLEELDYDFKQLPAPSELMGAEEAARYLADAISRQEKITIIGDYDVDGATSCTLIKESLELMGAGHVTYLVPDRFKLGYGLSPGIVDMVAEHAPDWLLTVDNGIASIEGVAAAKARGMGVIITDHHLPGKQLPDADVIVNPNQPGCNFPTKALAGVGVAFYVMLALRAELRARDWFNQSAQQEPNLATMLDLVALGTVADLVPLDHINRLLVRQGLDRINAGRCRPAIKVLLQIAKGEVGVIDAQDLGFSVAPRLNAAGRLDDMRLGIECLLSKTEAGALPLAEALNQWNLDRRKIQQDMEQQARQIVEGQSLNSDAAGVCLYSEDWHEGVVGLVASKIKDFLYRPTIVFAPADQAGLIKGSARSIKGIHIRDVLDMVATRAPEVLQKFGGHAMAAGLTIERQHLDDFQGLFIQAIEEVSEPSIFENVLWTDGPLEDENLTLESAQLLRELGPWGQRFPEPVFQGTFQVLDTYVLKQRHLKFQLGLSNGRRCEAIAFNQDEATLEKYFEEIEIAYRLMLNHFRGQTRLQLLIEHISP
jgi:single-stranded-DNA-specific exonuclease